jgi:uncharacterized protein (DUF433 family)
MDTFVTKNPQILGGTPCFTGTRVPVKSLFDHLEAGYNLEYFLTQFPTVTREQALGVLEKSREMTEANAAVVAAAR